MVGLVCKDGEKRSGTSTQSSHQTIVETNLKEAQCGDAGHAGKQGIASQFHHRAEKVVNEKR